MIKTIIFDLGGVLIDVDLQRMFDSIRHLGVDPDDLAKMAEEYAKAGEAGPDGAYCGTSTICEGVKAAGEFNKYQIGRISTEDFLGAIQCLAIPGTTYQQVVDAWNSCLLDLPQYKLDFVKELKQKGYTIHLLSNTNDAHWRFIEDTKFPEPASNYFTKLFLSQELHLAKPDTNIYKEVLRQIESPADECLFIDDSSDNCKAAEAVGIHTYNAPILTDYREEVRNVLRSFE